MRIQQYIAGVDEAGRGPLAGPVIAAAVILDPKRPISGLADSKKITEKKRELLFSLIQEQALAWAVGRAEVHEIDKVNILQATLLAMQRAVAALSITPTHIQVDGNCLPKLPCSAEAIIKGDQTVPVISAASIIAKVTRDREMLQWHEKYPQYDFAAHKGYGTELHLRLLLEHGPSPIHRGSFEPVRKLKKNYDTTT